MELRRINKDMGVSIIFGGQWGSEGKGKTTYFFSQKLHASTVVRVGGPNSGHTIIDKYGKRLSFQILPVAAVLDDVTCVLPAGSYIDIDILYREIKMSGLPSKNLKIHPNAVIVSKINRDMESAESLNNKIGSTESGTGDAVIARVKRDLSVHLARDTEILRPFLCDTEEFLRMELRKSHEILIEGTQGFGLSVLHAREYPYTTSRDTSAAAFLSEAGISPFDVKNIIMTLRAFPIRVAGNSGPLPKETTWKDVTRQSGARFDILEHTTVTKRVRRVAEFDAEIVKRSITSNSPNIVVLNHCDYFDYSINNKANLSYCVEEKVSEIEMQIGNVDYVGTGDRTLFNRR